MSTGRSFDKTLRAKEKAEEDQFFGANDRALIAKLKQKLATEAAGTVQTGPATSDAPNGK